MHSSKLVALLAGPLLAMQLLTSFFTPLSPARAEEAADPAKPKCEIAEVNPVTGHAICIKPIGAPVEMPPPEEEVSEDCQPGDESTEDWSWSSKCRPETVGQ
ncbi:hypothetical protein [Methyloligella solikamskensis]|uniref:Uncharacterized protein n=1 Tax=Methyloligella solikamskensis TaxID=1177756 RepID=A0ABW3JDY8_9HYPH